MLRYFLYVIEVKCSSEGLRTKRRRAVAGRGAFVGTGACGPVPRAAAGLWRQARGPLAVTLRGSRGGGGVSHASHVVDVAPPRCWALRVL